MESDSMERISVRVPPKMARDLRVLAGGRSPADLIRLALADYLKLRRGAIKSRLAKLEAAQSE